MRTFTSESVTEGHPDKVADTISDTILTEALRQDPNSRVAVETMVSAGQVFVAGEMTTSAWIDISEVARRAICDIGYDSADACFDGHTCGVLTNIVQQSSDIAQGVDKALEVRKIDEGSDPYDVEGAGDQGMMFGYATDETANLMPLPIAIAHALSTQLTKVRKDGTLPYLRPDGKTQVSIAYNDDNLPVAIDTIVVSTQHADDEQVFAQLHSDIMAYVIEPVLEEFKKTNPVVAAMDLSDVRVLVNPTGRFVNGGPAADSGLSGRKIIVDTYGGVGRHGGGAYCVDADTEFLTDGGKWKRIADYSEGDKVGVWHEDGHMTFEKPEAYIQTIADDMWRIHTSNRLDMVLSSNHDVVYWSTKGNLNKKKTGDLIKNFGRKDGTISLHGNVPTAYRFVEDTHGLRCGTDAATRVQVAFCADGTINKYNSARISLKRSRKIERLEMLLKLACIPYNKRVNSDGYTRFYFKPPILAKNLAVCFDKPTQEEMVILHDEVKRWDGNLDKGIFRTSLKEEADLIQHVFHSVTGKSASIRKDDRRGQDQKLNGKTYERKSIGYEVCETLFSSTSLRTSEPRQDGHVHRSVRYERFVPADGMMYCFTVSTGMLVLRRNDKVFITGNSGKDSTKVDRSASYAMRWVAKNIVAAGLAKRVEVQVAYAIGVARPVGFHLDTFGTNLTKLTDSQLADVVREVFDLRPAAIIDSLDLRHLDYIRTTNYGHFGKPELPWEQTNKVTKLREAVRSFVELS